MLKNRIEGESMVKEAKKKLKFLKFLRYKEITVLKKEKYGKGNKIIQVLKV